MSGRAVDAHSADSDAPTFGALFSAFLKIGLLGFGGVAAFARHVIVVERRFLDERGFAELFGVCSTLPGANTVNLSIMLGDRYRGPLGALAAVSGLMGPPLAVLVAVAALYERFGAIGWVRAGLAGAAAAAAGLVLGTAVKILRGLEPDAVTILTAGAVCLAAALARVPMPLILAVAIPVSLGIGVFRRASTRKPA